MRHAVFYEEARFQFGEIGLLRLVRSLGLAPLERAELGFDVAYRFGNIDAFHSTIGEIERRLAVERLFHSCHRVAPSNDIQ